MLSHKNVSVSGRKMERDADAILELLPAGFPSIVRAEALRHIWPFLFLLLANSPGTIFAAVKGGEKLGRLHEGTNFFCGRNLLSLWSSLKQALKDVFGICRLLSN